MARGRMLNNKVSSSRQMNDLLPDDTCRLLATWLISHLDKNGVFYGEPVMVKSLVLPRRTDVTVDQVEVYLQAMEDAGLIVRFQAREETWLWYPSFAQNQVGLRPERETSDFPLPPAMDEEPPEDEQADEPLPEVCRKDAGSLPESIRQDAGKHPAEDNTTEEKVNRKEDQTKCPAVAGKVSSGERKLSSTNGLTEGQRFWLSAFGAKRFANSVQREAVLALERDFGTDALKQGVEWAAKQGMAMGRAVTALETALPKWGKTKDGTTQENGRKVITVS